MRNLRPALVMLTVIGTILQLGYLYLYWQMHARMIRYGFVYVLAPPYLWLELLVLYPVMIGTPLLALALILSAPRR